MAERLPDNCAELVDKFAIALLNDAKAKLGFEIECTRSGKNKFMLCFKKTNGNKYLFSAVNEQFMQVNLDNIFRKAWPTLMLRPMKFVSIEQLSNDYKINKEDICHAIFRKLRKSCSYSCSNEPTFYSTCAEFMFNDDYDETVYKSPVFRNLTEILVWLDLNGNA